MKNFPTDFLKEKFLKISSRYTSKGAVIAERPTRKTVNVLKKPRFEKGFAYWIDKTNTIPKTSSDKKHSPNKSTPIQASLRKIESYVYQIFINEEMRKKPKFALGEIVSTADKNFL